MFVTMQYFVSAFGNFLDTPSLDVSFCVLQCVSKVSKWICNVFISVGQRKYLYVVSVGFLLFYIVYLAIWILLWILNTTYILMARLLIVCIHDLDNESYHIPFEMGISFVMFTNIVLLLNF